MSYSPTHLSPKGTSSVNGFSTQVRVEEGRRRVGGERKEGTGKGEETVEGGGEVIVERERRRGNEKREMKV